jgi:uncharacterized protein (UPF0303 family)
MNIEAELEILDAQEKRLRFPGFDSERAWQIGSRLRQLAEEGNLPIAFDISFGGTTLLYVSMPGASPDNADWIRRKKNAVLRFHKPSLRLRLERERAGVSLEAKFGVSSADFVASGGCFPLRIETCPLVLGTVTVSGLPDVEDHALVIRVLCEHLSIAPEVVGLTHP